MAEVSFESKGFPCMIVQHPVLGHLCGYIAVPQGHKFFKMPYTKVDRLPERPSVHGGLTYSGKNPMTQQYDKDLWWLGFDCAHIGYVPVDKDIVVNEYEWTVDEVKEELKSLADQLSKIQK